MGLAELLDAPVLLVGDIDRGGVFAQLLGTLMLLEKTEKERVKGLIINKFRGDKTILDPGVVMLEERGHVPVVGVVPYMELSIDDEDSLSSRFDRKEEAFDRYCSHPLSKNFQFYGSVCLRADRAGFRALCGQCERLTPPGHDRASGQ